MTLVSVIRSVLITTVIGFIMSHTGPGASGLTIAVAAPLLIAPVMSLQMLALLHRLDQTEERLRALSITDDRYKPLHEGVPGRSVERNRDIVDQVVVVNSD